MMQRQRGVALVQVLLVTTIIILLVMQLSLTAADQVKRAQQLQDRSEAALYLHSREVALFYTLLTESMNPASASSNPYAANWNFHGDPFVVDGLEFRLQDQSGLMRFPALDVFGFEQLLTALEVGPTRVRDLAGQLANWIGVRTSDVGRPDGAMMRGESGDPVQYFGELLLLPGMDEQLYGKLAELMTLYPTPGFNPMTAPAALLGMHMPDSTAQAVLAARDNGELDQNRLWQLARIAADEAIVVYTGPGVGIRIAGEYRGVTLRRSLVVSVEPYEPEPLALWSRERLAGEIPK